MHQSGSENEDSEHKRCPERGSGDPRPAKVAMELSVGCVHRDASPRQTKRQ